MPVIAIEDAADPRLAGYSLLADPAALRRAGWFVAEGRLVVERLLGLGQHAIESLLLSESALRSLAPRLGQHAERLAIYLCPAALFERVTGHDFHRGCLGLVRRPPALDPEVLLGSARLVVVLEGVANADNVGGVFRNAAAFGADAVLLDPASADPLYRKAIRTSMGACSSVPFARLGAVDSSASGAAARPWPEALGLLAARGFELLALTPQPPSLELDAWAARAGSSRPLALLLGAEGSGLSSGALERATQRVRIPMRGEVDSLNLAVACGIALHRLRSLGR